MKLQLPLYLQQKTPQIPSPPFRSMGDESTFSFDFIGRVHDSLVARALDCQPRGRGFKSPSGQKLLSRFRLQLRPLAISAVMSTLTIHCEYED